MRLGVLDVILGADAAQLQQGRRALAQDLVELGAVQLQGRLAAGSRRRQAGDLMVERLLGVCLL
jgi:ribosomal 50S subunit-recycling heat shock protein